MEFDIVLPLVLFVIVVISVASYRRFEKKAKNVLEDRKFGIREIIIMVISMGVLITVIAFSPEIAIQILFLAAYSYMLFSFVYIASNKWYLSVLPPAIFILAYFLYPSLLVLNIFAAFFAVMISIYIGVLFSWKTTLIFALLLTIMDIIQVIGTGFMVTAAEKMVGLKLPVAVILPTFPGGKGILLGLGDIFLGGLLAIQTALRKGQRAGIITAASVGLSMFIFEVLIFNSLLGGFRGFPATVVVILGWLLGMGIVRLTIKETKSELTPNSQH